MGGIMLVFLLFTGLSLWLSLRATKEAERRAAVVQVAARQRTLAERYANSVLLSQAGAQANPDAIATTLAQSATALLDGGLAPAVDGDDDQTIVPRSDGRVVRLQLKQEQKVIADLVATGGAIVSGRSELPKLKSGEHLGSTLSPVQRLLVLTGLTSNVSLNVSRTIEESERSRLSALTARQMLLGGLGVFVFGLLSWALVTSTRRQSAHFRSLVAATTDLVLAFSDGRCRYASRSVLRMLGRTEEEVVDGGFAEVVHPDDLDTLCEALATGSPSTIAFRLPRHDGDWRELEANVTDLRQERHVHAIVLNARDVTERNRAYAEREELLAQEMVANERLRELDSMKDEFVALVSHELRTPLTAIQGYTEMVLEEAEGELSAEQRTMLGAVSRNSMRLFRLINDLLFVAQVNAGKLTVAIEDVDLAAVAAEAVTDAQTRATAAHVRLELECEATPTIKADRVRLAQVFDNLISNAIKFTPAGGNVRLTVSVVGEEALIVVADSGMGMTAEDQQRLFTRFFRTKAAAQVQGTGLGLSITKAIVDAHRGSISVESEVGQGTRFTVVVPANEEPQPVAA